MCSQLFHLLSKQFCHSERGTRRNLSPCYEHAQVSRTTLEMIKNFVSQKILQINPVVLVRNFYILKPFGF